jgi:glycosyltransferase involved in cell wall biosynthesis
MINILFIPSWLPGRGLLRVNGVFSIHQAEIINKFSLKYRPIIVEWGQGREYIPLTRPWELREWRRVRKQLRNTRVDRNNGVRRLKVKPPIMWSHQLPLGGHQRLVPKIMESINEVYMQEGLKIDLIHAHVSYPGGYLASKISKELNVPYVLTEFMGPFPFPHFRRFDSMYEEFIAKPIRGASENLVLSQYLKERYGLLGLPEPEIVPFSVDGARFKPIDEDIVNENRASKQDKSARLLFIGSIIKEKGVSDLLQALKILHDSGRRVTLSIIGDGKDASRFHKLANELTINHMIEWKGLVDNQDLPDMLHKADIFVMPSWHDTFGVVYVEAMACGLPIVATRCGGPDSFITDEIGKLVPVKSPNHLAQAIGEMIDSLQSYSRNTIRRRFEENFSDENIVRKLEEVYDRVLMGYTT